MTREGRAEHYLEKGTGATNCWGTHGSLLLAEPAMARLQFAPLARFVASAFEITLYCSQTGKGPTSRDTSEAGMDS